MERKYKTFFLLLFAFFSFSTKGQQSSISGTVSLNDEFFEYATVELLPLHKKFLTNENGGFHFHKLNEGEYVIVVSIAGFQPQSKKVNLKNKPTVVNFYFTEENVAQLDNVIVSGTNDAASGRLKDVSGTAIYAGKKTELINVKALNANLAANNTRQIYARVPGLNIWEYDRGGLQLGIGGRGLSPNRSSNFNIRQNGYDISADALGYPESYYTPSSEAVDRIEIVRGAASLQYGPQFGGLINFIMKEGAKEKTLEITSRQTIGNWGFFNSFNSLGGTIAKNKLNYYAFYQYKKGDSWRANNHFEQHNACAQVKYDISSRLKLTADYSHMNYLAQQPGGLTDAQFAEDPSVSVRPRNWFKVDWNLINLSLDYKINRNTLLNWRNYTLQAGRTALGNLSYINRPDIGGTRDMMLDKYNNWASEFRLLHQYSLFNNLQSALLVGIRAYKGSTIRKQGDANADTGPDFYFGGDEPSKSSYHFPGTNFAAFAENTFTITKNWNITPGVRFEYIHTKANGYYYKQNVFVKNDKIIESKSSPRSFVLFGIGTARKLSNGTEVYANISQNYRSINFNDIRVVNQNAKVDSTLKDETGYNIDFGYRGRILNWLYADISAFYLKYNNRIGSMLTSDKDNTLYRLRTNISDSRNIGLEFLLDGDVLKIFKCTQSQYKLNVYTAFSAINAIYIKTQNTAIAGKLVENVPPLMFRCGTGFGNSRFNVGIQYEYQSKSYSDATNAEETPTAVDGAIPAFSVVDLSVKYNWRMFTIFSGINNVFDKNYFTRRADGYPGPGIIPSDKINFYLTLQFKL